VITNQALPDRDLGLLIQIAGILIAAGLTRVALEWTQSRSLLLPQQQGAARSQLASIQRMLALPIGFFRTYSIGDLQLRFGALDRLREEIQSLLDGGLLKVVLSSIYALFLLKISVKLTLLAFVIALMLLIPTAILGIQSRPLQRRQEEINGQAQSRNLELISSVSKLRLAGAETRAAHWWAEQFRRTVVLEQALDAKEAIGKLLGSIIPNLGNLLLYVVITKLLAEAAAMPNLSAPNAGQLLGFFSAFGTFIGAMASFAELLVGAFDVPVIYEFAQPILKASPEVSDALLDVPVLQGGLEFDRVSYRYEPDLPLVLDTVSFNARPGKFLAIVGPSGSGKSTIVRLMLAFDKPENGVIRYDGQSLNGLRPDSLRRQIGTVMQSNALFSGSLFEAIAGGQVISIEQAWEAAEQAGLADDIQQMPMGMQTVIPEGGGTLSGGQRQRVAIARAIVRRPRLLIFDEATSALDNRTQAVVSQSLEKLSITRVVIAHRLSTIRHADQIVVLQAGQVRQQGGFDNLLAEDGLFARMMERQIA
jgi:ATP-binding cassette subfamily B protein